jgi:hypothetical protein
MTPAGSTAGTQGYMMACEPKTPFAHLAPSGHIAAIQRTSAASATLFARIAVGGMGFFLCVFFFRSFSIIDKVPFRSTILRF